MTRHYVGPHRIRCVKASGVCKIWQRGPRRACRAQAYNGGLGAEPTAGSRGRALKHFLLLNAQWKTQIHPFFWNLETQKITDICVV